jgi:hypothetical protein
MARAQAKLYWTVAKLPVIKSEGSAAQTRGVPICRIATCFSLDAGLCLSLSCSRVTGCEKVDTWSILGAALTMERARHYTRRVERSSTPLR